MASAQVVLLSGRRCIGESPPIYGARKAYADVEASFKGPCVLKYELSGVAYSCEFDNYRQALTAATMAIFSDHSFTSVFLSKSVSTRSSGSNLTAKTWYMQISSEIKNNHQNSAPARECHQ